MSNTHREIKNQTGLDVTVGSYDPAPTPKQVKYYHVVVITRLPFFKQPEHSDQDTVQFMVTFCLIHEGSNPQMHVLPK